jgi:hypothetical protein
MAFDVTEGGKLLQIRYTQLKGVPQSLQGREMASQKGDKERQAEMSP